MSGTRQEHLGGGQGQDCEIDGGGAQEKETERKQTAEESSLFVILKRSGLSAETLSALARHRDSFGLAWLCCRLYMENKASWKTSVDPPQAIDLSETIGLSAKKVIFFLDWLPDSVEEVKLGPRAAIPLFVRFLEKEEAARESGRRKRLNLSLQVKSWRQNSIGPEEAPILLPVLLPSLEKLSLKGNILGIEGFRALAEGMREGKAGSLKVLDLEETGFEKEGLMVLCQAIKETGLKVEELNLSGNPVRPLDIRSDGSWEEGEIEAVCSVLSVSSLPCLRVLFLRGCRLGDSHVQQLCAVLGRGDVPNLESLNLEGNLKFPESTGLDCLVRALRVDSLPHLKNLNVITEGGFCGTNMASFFLSSLKSEQCPPLENVSISLNHDAREDVLCALGGGQSPFVRTLSLGLPPSLLVTFLKAVLDSQAKNEGVEGGPFEDVDIRMTAEVWVGDETQIQALCECLRLLGEGIRRGWLGFLKKVQASLWCVGGWNFEIQLGGSSEQWVFIEEAKHAFFSSLSAVQVCGLSELSIQDLQLSDADMILGAEGVRVGSLCGLRVLDLSCESSDASGCFGREGMEALVRAILENERGLPSLETLNFRNTRAGCGVGSLGSAFLAGKFPKLCDLDLRKSSLTDEGVSGLADVVRGGGLMGVRVLDLGSHELVRESAWREFFQAIRDNRWGLPQLKSLILKETRATHVGGPLAAAVGRGRLPSLQTIWLSVFCLDEEGVGDFADAVRVGKFPPHLQKVGFCLSEGGPAISVDTLIRAIGESEKGLPSSVSVLNLRGGRLEEEALAFLANSGEGSGVWGGRLAALGRLDLSGCAIDDGKLKRLGEVFTAHGAPKLTCLKVKGNTISIKGLTAFIDVLRPGCLPQLKQFLVEDPDEVVGDEEKFALAIKAETVLPTARGSSH
uniref:Uncharacterized protein n=1 Tax=Chromera velia CCMP2878 TaxID=1169474 RepID=A0A0G4F1V7_9ALVE|eukprot:Cvel_14548.t1-p1 / transcript=Cvel_14548.t1 / gene=Cvel_14548 / organism=Chromera_velia_CCMP2878 / gene_product=hypothetical protein / transcript_product=hypothetical protein / location=Cvel_scaffold1040:985-6135(-) / protein_length=907 / sequence_SO=supercontig / SO=protein_coding / is_pseudo=false